MYKYDCTERVRSKCSPLQLNEAIRGIFERHASMKKYIHMRMHESSTTTEPLCCAVYVEYVRAMFVMPLHISDI
jgi:hypothetical protein